jgi:hypothetical protein
LIVDASLPSGVESVRPPKRGLTFHQELVKRTW